MTKRVNDIYHVMIAFHLVRNVVNVCVLIYILLWNEKESVIIAGSLFWIILITISLIIISMVT